jgi:hypothetical protein
MNSTTHGALSRTSVLLDRHMATRTIIQRAAHVLLAVVILSLPVANAWAQATHGGSGTPKVKPAKVNSFVKTSDGKTLWDGATGYVGTNYAGTLATFPGASVDVLMQQCFGGGFASGIDASLAGVKGYTFTSASNWNEYAQNAHFYTAVPHSAATLSAVNNFTRAWNDSFPREEGLFTHYTDSVLGAPEDMGPPPYSAVPQDPFAFGGVFRNLALKTFENPTYASPDPTVLSFPNPMAPNNSRDIEADNQYAVLVSWEPDRPRFDVNLNRIYASLRHIGIPASHIVVLSAGATTAAIPNMGPLAAIPVTGPATEKNFKDAIAGALFPPAEAPDADSQLFVYNTGHGGSLDARGAKAKATVAVNPGPPKKLQVIANDALDLPATAFTDADGDASNIGDIRLQITTRTPLDNLDLLGGVSVAINGTPIGVLSISIAPLDLTPVFGTGFYYEVQAPLSFVNSLSPGPVTIDLDNMFNSSVYDGLVTAVTFDAYRDTWSIGVDPIPEPAAVALVLTALTALPHVRRRS